MPSERDPEMLTDGAAATPALDDVADGDAGAPGDLAERISREVLHRLATIDRAPYDAPVAGLDRIGRIMCDILEGARGVPAHDPRTGRLANEARVAAFALHRAEHALEVSAAYVASARAKRTRPAGE